VLVDVWKQLLKLERVGINQDFFELGGHSLLATQLVSRAQEAFMVEVELRRFFENPTIAALAATIVESKKAPAQTRVPAVQPISRELENTEVAATVAAYSESEIDGLLKKILKENTTNE
jgi:acyl carrier protein